MTLLDFNVKTSLATIFARDVFMEIKMASLQKRKRKNGTAYVIQFMESGQRRTLFLGSKYTKAVAREIKDVVEKVLDSRSTGIPLDARTEAWLAILTDDMRRRLISAGIIKEKEVITLGDLLDRFLTANHSWSYNTVKRHSGSVARLSKVFDCSVPASDFTKPTILAAKEQLEEMFSNATAATTIKTCVQAYRWGIDFGLVSVNPFDGVKNSSFKNKSREFFVDRELFDRILDVCEDERLRNALVLYRYGGLRRGEAFLLRWDMIDYEDGVIEVLSPKTACNGKDRRIVPMFPEIRKNLRTIDRPVNNLVVSDLNSRSVHVKFAKLLERNNIPIWPRLLQNLRSSRAIEINEKFGSIAESEWLGHTQDVAKDHYLSVSKDLFKSAVG